MNSAAINTGLDPLKCILMHGIAESYSSAVAYMWNSEDLVLSFYPVDLKDEPQVITVSKRYFYPMSHLEPIFLAFFQFLYFY